MARGRMIATTVADDKRFNELPIDAALVYLMAIPQLDRDGLILGEPAVLWGTVCRRRPELLPRMADIVAAWVSSGLVLAYKTDDGDTVLYFVGFQKNQAMTHYDREAVSRFPCPPGYSRTPKGLVPEVVQQPEKHPADKLRTYSGPAPDEVLPNVIQSNVNQSNAKDDPQAVAAVFACWKDNMPGTLSSVLADDLGDLIDTYGSDSVIRAITEAVRSNGRSIKYVSKILENWAVGGKHRNGAAPPSTANGIVAGFSLDDVLGKGAIA